LGQGHSGSNQRERKLEGVNRNATLRAGFRAASDKAVGSQSRGRETVKFEDSRLAPLGDCGLAE
jgi:hypothetical protein